MNTTKADTKTTTMNATPWPTAIVASIKKEMADAMAIAIEATAVIMTTIDAAATVRLIGIAWETHVAENLAGQWKSNEYCWACNSCYFKWCYLICPRDCSLRSSYKELHCFVLFQNREAPRTDQNFNWWRHGEWLRSVTLHTFQNSIQKLSPYFVWHLLLCFSLFWPERADSVVALGRIIIWRKRKCTSVLAVAGARCMKAITAIRLAITIAQHTGSTLPGRFFNACCFLSSYHFRTRAFWNMLYFHLLQLSSFPSLFLC